MSYSSSDGLCESMSSSNRRHRSDDEEKRKEKLTKIGTYIIGFLLFVCVAAFIRRLWGSLPANIVDLDEWSETADGEFPHCLTDSCLRLDRCFRDADRIFVYVQPLMEFRSLNGKRVPKVSKEFIAIRSAIASSRFAVGDPEKACLVVPGVDLLNLKEFHPQQERDIRQAIGAAASALPQHSNLLLFNFVALREPIHLKHIWASASLDNFSLRRKFDVSIPMWRPYSLGQPQQPATAREQWTVVIRFGGETIRKQLLDALSSKQNVSIVMAAEAANGTAGMSTVTDQYGNERDYPTLLRDSVFTIISDVVPAFQMVLMDAMEFGSIPVIISDDYLPPFHEALDWSRFSVRIAQQNLSRLPQLLDAIDSKTRTEMRANVRRVYERYLGTEAAIALSTLQLIERRIVATDENGFESAVGMAESKLGWPSIPIRSTATSLTVILVVDGAGLADALSRLEAAAAKQIKSILIIQSDPSSRPTPQKTSTGMPIQYSEWSLSNIQSDLRNFVDSILYRPQIVADCWLLVDARNGISPQLNAQLFTEALEAWRENADSILTLPIASDSKSPAVAPFYRGLAFAYPFLGITMLRAARICQTRCVRLYSQFNPAQNGFFDNQEDLGGDFNRMSNSRPPRRLGDQKSFFYQHAKHNQSLSWPAALSGRDMISIDYTGSGKTLGFILPGVLHTLAQPGRNNKKGPTVVVLLPTRELSQQVEVVAQPFCRAAKLAITSVFGGASKNVQAMRLQDGVDVLIATPGRMLDLLEAKVLSLSNCSYLVFDEADRMLDMGFEPQIRKVVSQIRSNRQTLMFSTTWPKEVQELAADFQKDPVFLNVGSLELSANHDIKQKVEIIDPVVNYDYPNTPADYIHRIGRTGRGGKASVGHVLFTQDENGKVHDFAKCESYLNLALPYSEFDVLLSDIDERELDLIGKRCEREHLAASAFPSPEFPVSGMVYGPNLRYMVPLVCQIAGKPNAPVLNVVFIADTGSPYTFLSQRTLNAINGTENTVYLEDEFYRVAIQDQKSKVECRVSKAHFAEANLLGADALRDLKLNIVVDWTTKDFILVRT